jgi:hypothetical protein
VPLSPFALGEVSSSSLVTCHHARQLMEARLSLSLSSGSCTRADDVDDADADADAADDDDREEEIPTCRLPPRFIASDATSSITSFLRS